MESSIKKIFTLIDSINNKFNYQQQLRRSVKILVCVFVNFKVLQESRAAHKLTLILLIVSHAATALLYNSSFTHCL